MKDADQVDGEIAWLGVTYKTILPPGASGGAMSIVDTTAPEGRGPPRHIHDREDEVFVALTGQCEFWLEGARFVRGPGQTAFVPRSREHTFRVIGDQPSRHPIVLTLGASRGSSPTWRAASSASPRTWPRSRPRPARIT